MKSKMLIFKCTSHELTNNFRLIGEGKTEYWEKQIGKKAWLPEGYGKGNVGWEISDMVDAKVNNWVSSQKGIRVVDIRHAWTGEIAGGGEMVCVTTILYKSGR
jgi:hypothetical protein